MSTDLFNNRKIYLASFVFVTIHSASFCSRKEKRNSKFSHPIQHHFLCLGILINFLERFSSSEQTKLYNTNTLTIKLFKMLEFNKYLSLIRKCSVYKRGFKCLLFQGNMFNWCLLNLCMQYRLNMYKKFLQLIFILYFREYSCKHKMSYTNKSAMG